MGAWGVGAFEDDASLDWLHEEYVASGASAVASVLAEVASFPVSQYLESSPAVEARAAAELVAAAFGNGLQGIDGETQMLLNEHAKEILALPDIKKTALAALARIRTENSELNELWSEGEETKSEWVGSISDLQERLGK